MSILTQTQYEYMLYEYSPSTRTIKKTTPRIPAGVQRTSEKQRQPTSGTKQTKTKTQPQVATETPFTDAFLKEIEDIPEQELDNFIDEVLNNNPVFPDEIPVADELGKTLMKERIGLVWPMAEARDHEAAPLLDAYSKYGCPVVCDDPWTKEMVIAALKRGNHISAKDPEAREYLIKEVERKVAEGYQIVVRWGDIKDDLPENIKLSPVACIPHKSRAYRVILDLSFRLLFRGKRLKSVNEATVLQAPQKAMCQLGNVLPRIINLLAKHFNLSRPFKFAKVDIKDGFWRMAVSPKDAWHFCYAIPPKSPDESIDDRLIVVPTALAMGWAESPPFFCAATETGRDVIQRFLDNPSPLPPHPSEYKMYDDTTALDMDPFSVNDGIDFIEVYVDDFIGGTNNLSKPHLQFLSRAMLHGINSIFPKREISRHNGEDPISQKKMDEGDGYWAYRKEILGWIFDGEHFTIQLPQKKVEKLRASLKSAAKSKAVKLTQFQSIAGKLNHASFGIPNGKALSAPIYRATRGDPAEVQITPHVKLALQDWNVILQQIASRPTHMLELTPSAPAFIGFVDACKHGIGGVWLSGTERLQPTVWRTPIPKELQDKLVSNHNPNGSLTINDLEMAGILTHWLVLEKIAPCSLRHTNVGIYCDNTSAVSWAQRLSSTSSIIANHLLRALAVRQHVHRTSPLLCMNIAGTNNDIADVPSRSFQNYQFTNSNQPFVHTFASLFPLKQPHSWKEFHLPTKLSSRVMSLLHGNQLTLGLWMQTPGQDKNTGLTGKSTVPSSTPALTSANKIAYNKVFSLQHLQHEFGLELTAKASESKPKQSQRRWEPSPRPSNWLENAPQSLNQRRHTPRQWHGQWRVGGERIRPLSHNSRSRSRSQATSTRQLEPAPKRRKQQEN